MARYNSRHKKKNLPSAVKDKKRYNHEYYLKVEKKRRRERRKRKRCEK